MPRGRFLRMWLGEILPDKLAGGLRQSWKRVQLLLADAFPQISQNHAGEYRRKEHDGLLPDQLHADGCAKGCRLFACAIPPGNSAEAEGPLYDRGWNRRRRTIRRHVPCMAGP